MEYFVRLVPQKVQNDCPVHSRFQIIDAGQATQMINKSKRVAGNMYAEQVWTSAQWTHRLTVDGRGGLSLFLHLEGGYGSKPGWCPLWYGFPQAHDGVLICGTHTITLVF